MADGILNIIQRKNPDKEFDILKQIGSGTYGEVYKVRWLFGLTVAMVNRDETYMYLYSCVCQCVIRWWSIYTYLPLSSALFSIIAAHFQAVTVGILITILIGDEY